MAALRPSRLGIYCRRRWWLVALLVIVGLAITVTRWHEQLADTVSSRRELEQELARCFDSAERIDVHYGSSGLVLSASSGDAAFEAVRRELRVAVTDGNVVGVEQEPEAFLYIVKKDGTPCGVVSLYSWYIGFKGERFKVDALPQDILDIANSLAK